MQSYWDSATIGGYTLRIMATWLYHDAPTNRSRVRYQQWLMVEGGRLLSNIACSTQGYISGQTPLNYSGPISVTGPENRLLTETDVWINHNSDGTGSLSVTGYFEAPGYVSQLSIVNRPMALPTIARATTPTLSAASVNAGSDLTINLPRASTAFTHEVKWSFGAASGVIATAAATSAVWSVPMSVLEQIPTATQGICTLTVITKQGGSVIGTRTIQVTISAPASAVPTIGGINHSEATPGLAALVAAYVQSKSRLALAMTSVAGVHGSTIASASLSVAGQVLTGESGTTAPIGMSGTVTITASVTDSRGRVGTRTQNVTLLAYTPPKLTAPLVRRAIAAGTISPSGTYLRADVSAQVASLIVGGVQKNSMSVNVYSRLRSTPPPGTLRDTPVTPGVTWSGASLLSGHLASQSYDVLVVLTDALGTVDSQAAYLPAEGVPVHVSRDGVGIGKVHEQGALDVVGDIYAGGELVLTDADPRVLELLRAMVPIGVSLDFAGDTAPPGFLLHTGAAVSRTGLYAPLFAVIGTKFGPGNGTSTFNLPGPGRFIVSRDSGQTEFDTVGTTGGAKTHTLTVAQMPAHNHGVGYLAQSGGTPGGLANWSNINPSNMAGQGSGQAHPILPPFEVWNRIIRAY